MPAEIELLRETYRRQALAAMGALPKTQSSMVANVLSHGNEAEILALPFDSRLYAPLQDEDGNFLYMADYDPVDSAPMG